jgi:hypothetical protein
MQKFKKYFGLFFTLILATPFIIYKLLPSNNVVKSADQKNANRNRELANQKMYYKSYALESAGIVINHISMDFKNGTLHVLVSKNETATYLCNHQLNIAQSTYEKTYEGEQSPTKHYIYNYSSTENDLLCYLTVPAHTVLSIDGKNANVFMYLPFWYSEINLEEGTIGLAMPDEVLGNFRYIFSDSTIADEQFISNDNISEDAHFINATITKNGTIKRVDIPSVKTLEYWANPKK